MDTRKLSDWSEIIASIAVVLSLLFLLQEVRGNTRAIERQAGIDRASSFADPFFESPELRVALTKVRAVDGPLPIHEALMERYPFTLDEAILWTRHLQEFWLGLEADYRYGDQAAVRGVIGVLLRYPDNRIYVENAEMGFGFGMVVREILAQTPMTPDEAGP